MSALQKPRGPGGIILVAHEVLAPISQEDMLNAIPREYLDLPREIVRLRAVSARQSELSGFDWATARREQAHEVEARLLPLAKANPAWRIQYFGAAPIPLAMDLGYALGGWTAADIYQQRHDTNAWAWPRTGRTEGVRFQHIDLPTERIAARGQVVIRVSTSHQIDASETMSVVADSLGEVDIALIAPNEDALESVADLEALREQFDKVVDWAHTKRPNADLHVFAAVTVGAAFRLGMAVNPTIHSLVHTYQYSKASSPRYQCALVLQTREQPSRPVSAEQVEDAARVRGQISEELAQIRSVAAQLRERDTLGSAVTWLATLIPEGSEEILYAPARTLAKIFDTPLADSSVDLITTSTPESFSYDPASRMWRFDDRFLVSLSEQFPTEADLRQAGRLLILHEGIHLASHRLTGATAPQVRRFPKIVEELDYQADVWAYVHDYAIQMFGKHPSGDDTRAYLIHVVTVALDTFWAFDSAGDRERIEIRRLNRYLIWYWQLLRLEASSNLEDALRVLANRPLIEIAGPRIESSDNRVFYALDPAKFNEPELGLLYKQRIVRYGQAPGARVKDILLGFRERDSNKIREALKSISDQVAD